MATKEKEILIQATAQMNLGNIMLYERSQTQKYIQFHLYEISRIRKSIYMENRQVVTRSWVERGIGSDCNECGVSFGTDEKALKFIVVMVACLHEFTANH